MNFKAMKPTNIKDSCVYCKHFMSIEECIYVNDICIGDAGFCEHPDPIVDPKDIVDADYRCELWESVYKTEKL